MAVTGALYGLFFTALANEEHDLADDTIKVMLTTSAYTPDQDAHNYKDDVTNEVTGTGYTATGATLANKTITYTAGTNTWKFDADDATWTTSTITARTAVVYNATGGGTDATRGLIGYQQSDTDITSSGGTFTVAWHADGIVSIVVGT